MVVRGCFIIMETGPRSRAGLFQVGGSLAFSWLRWPCHRTASSPLSLCWQIRPVSGDFSFPSILPPPFTCMRAVGIRCHLFRPPAGDKQGHILSCSFYHEGMYSRHRKTAYFILCAATQIFSSQHMAKQSVPPALAKPFRPRR